MDEPHEQPKSEIWSRWRARRAARATPPPAPEPPSPPEPEPEPEIPEPPEPEPEPRAHTHVDGRECLDWCPICRTADVIRASVPPELRDQWHDVQREALSTLRAAIDHYLSRLEQESAPPEERVQDIPIE